MRLVGSPAAPAILLRWLHKTPSFEPSEASAPNSATESAVSPPGTSANNDDGPAAGMPLQDAGNSRSASHAAPAVASDAAAPEEDQLLNAPKYSVLPHMTDANSKQPLASSIYSSSVDDK